MEPSSGPREIRLSTTPDQADLDALELGDIVWLDGLIYTAALDAARRCRWTCRR